MLFAIKRILLCVILLGVISHAHAEEDICKRDDTECIQPSTGLYKYGYQFGTATFSSVEELAADTIARAVASPEVCAVTYTRDGDWISYSEEGRGFISTVKHHNRWYLSTNMTEVIQQGIQFTHTVYNQENQCVAEIEYPPVHLARLRNVSCPSGYSERTNKGERSAVCAKTVIPPQECANSDTVGQPCQVSTGAKVRVENDFSTNSFTFTRHYHSQNLSNKGFGKGWHNVYLKRLTPRGNDYYVGDGLGRALHSATDSIISDFQLTQTTDERIVTHATGHVDIYDTQGRLLRSTTPAGEETAYTYSETNEGRQLQITDHYNKSIVINYDSSDFITTVTDPSGSVYRYEYDNLSNLTAVIFPDLTPSDLSDNPRKIYHYEDPDFPNHLTGITDENNRRHQTYIYNDDGHAISTEKAVTTNAVGQGRFDIQYQD